VCDHVAACHTGMACMSFISFCSRGWPAAPVAYTGMHRDRRIYGTTDDIPTVAAYRRLFNDGSENGHT
jgi:hypothetical protein